MFFSLWFSEARSTHSGLTNEGGKTPWEHRLLGHRDHRTRQVSPLYGRGHCPCAVHQCSSLTKFLNPVSLAPSPQGVGVCVCVGVGVCVCVCVCKRE